MIGLIYWPEVLVVQTTLPAASIEDYAVRFEVVVAEAEDCHKRKVVGRTWLTCSVWVVA